MSRHLVTFLLALLCAASVYADDGDKWGGLGDSKWWTSDGEPHPDPHGPQLPPWLTFVLNGRPGVDGRDGRQGDKGQKGDCGERGLQGPQGMVGDQGDTGEGGETGDMGDKGSMGCKGYKGQPGTVGSPADGDSVPVTRLYMRWGVPSCPADRGASLAYSGRAATSFHNNAGSGANLVCIRDEFSFTGVWQPIDMSRSSVFGSIVGIEYIATAGDPLVVLNDDNVPCAVCTVEASAVFMQPGRTTCPDGWTVQYTGYIMSELLDQSGTRESENYRSQFVCVDENSMEIADLQIGNIEARLTHVHVACDETDILPCDEGFYDEGHLSCTVCSKNLAL